MAKYSKRRRSRRGSKRKRRGGNVVASLNAGVGAVGAGFEKGVKHGKDAVAKGQEVVGNAGKDLKEMGDNITTGVFGAASEISDATSGAASEISNATSGVVSSVLPSGQTGGRRGGSGRCCFPAKFCGSRKRKGNKRRSIRTGRCCLPVKSKKCGAKKKNGRKTKKNKRKRKRGTNG